MVQDQMMRTKMVLNNIHKESAKLVGQLFHRRHHLVDI